MKMSQSREDNSRTISNGRKKKRNGKLQTHQLEIETVAYLWEICYDLPSSKENVSESPGFESLGLRVNRKKSNFDE